MSRHASQVPQGCAVMPPACAGEQVGVVQALVRQRIRERLHDVFLADQGLEVARPVLAGQDQGGHALDSTRAIAAIRPQGLADNRVP
jgi:hypothetical protein